jgi:hypothetical protein
MYLYLLEAVVSAVNSNPSIDSSLLLFLNIGTLVGMLFTLTRFGFAIGKVYKELEGKIEKSHNSTIADLRLQYYELTTEINKLTKRLESMEQTGEHRDELSSIRQESVINTIVADIANIVINIDDIELYLMKKGYHRRSCKLIHGKKRKLTPEDIITLEEF